MGKSLGFLPYSVFVFTLLGFVFTLFFLILTYLTSPSFPTNILDSVSVLAVSFTGLILILSGLGLFFSIFCSNYSKCIITTSLLCLFLTIANIGLSTYFLLHIPRIVTNDTDLVTNLCGSRKKKCFVFNTPPYKWFHAQNVECQENGYLSAKKCSPYTSVLKAYQDVLTHGTDSFIATSGIVAMLLIIFLLVLFNTGQSDFPPSTDVPVADFIRP